MALIRESSNTYSGTSSSVTLTGGLSNSLVIAIIKGDAGVTRALDAATLDGASADFMENLSRDSGRAISSAVYYWLDAKHPGAGSFTLATTWSGVINNVQMQVIEYSGAHQTTTISTIATNVEANQADGATITSTLTGQAGELALSFEAQADSSAASLSGSIVPSVNLSSLTGPDVFAGQSRLAVGEDSSVASASEDYTWTISQDGMTVTDSLVTGSFAIFAAASGGISIVVDSGSYSQVGTTTPISAQLNIITTSGSYLLTGSDVNLTSAKKLIAETGSYDLTGTDVILIYTPGGGGETITVNSGVYSLAGDEVLLRADLSIIANSDNYSITGTTTPIKYNASITVDSGSYSLVGADLNLFANYGMIAVSNSYSLTGTSVTLRYSGDTSQVIGTVTAGFAPDLYSAGYKPNTITVTFKE